MGMTPKVNHSRSDFNLMFLTLGIFTTEGTNKKKIIIMIIIIIEHRKNSWCRKQERFNIQNVVIGYKVLESSNRYVLVLF